MKIYKNPKIEIRHFLCEHIITAQQPADVSNFSQWTTQYPNGKTIEKDYAVMKLIEYKF